MGTCGALLHFSRSHTLVLALYSSLVVNKRAGAGPVWHAVALGFCTMALVEFLYALERAVVGIHFVAQRLVMVAVGCLSHIPLAFIGACTVTALRGFSEVALLIQP